MNDFIVNAKIPVYKKSFLHQKPEDEQLNSLVTRKNAFSTGGLWMVLGFQLMGSSSTTCAQLAQIEQDNIAATEAREKKAEE